MSNLDMGEIINRAIFHKTRLEELLQGIQEYDTAITLVKWAMKDLGLDPEAQPVLIHLMQHRVLLVGKFLDIFLGEEQDLV